MKRTLSLIAAIMMMAAALCLTMGCTAAQQPGPSQVTDSALNAIVTHNYDELKGYYAGDLGDLVGKAANAGSKQGADAVTSLEDLTDEQKSKLEELANRFLEFDYKITGESVNGDKATVNVDFTNYDLGKPATSIVQKVLPTIIGASLSGSKADKDKIMDTVLEEISAATSDLGEKNVTKSAYIKLSKNAEGAWKIDDLSNADEEYSSQLFNAMFGGVLDSINKWADDLASSFSSIGNFTDFSKQ